MHVILIMTFETYSTLIIYLMKFPKSLSQRKSKKEKPKYSATRRLLLKVGLLHLQAKCEQYFCNSMLLNPKLYSVIKALLFYSPNCWRRQLLCWWLKARQRNTRKKELWTRASLHCSSQVCQSRSSRYWRSEYSWLKRYFTYLDDSLFFKFAGAL